MVITNEAGIAQVSPANTYAGLTTACSTCEEGEPDIYRPSGDVNYFRVSGNDDNQGSAGASWAYCLGYDSVYILDDTQAYGKGIADVFEAQAEAIGMEVVGHSSVESTDIDFRALLTDVLASGAELVYGGFVLDSGGPQVIQQMNEVGLFEEGIDFMGPDGLASPALFEQIGGVEVANDHTFITFPAPQPSEVESDKGLRLYEGYVAAYDEEPDPYAIYAYDGMMVILDAIERAGAADRAAILEAIAGTSEFEGVLGTFGFNEDGDNNRAAFYGYEVSGDNFANGTLITADMVDSCERAE
jgi:branched-chain amino acid transport system substrate-binding protein